MSTLAHAPVHTAERAQTHLCISLSCPDRRRSSSDSTESAGLWPRLVPAPAVGWPAESPLCAPSESPLPPLTAHVLLTPLVPLRCSREHVTRLIMFVVDSDASTYRMLLHPMWRFTE